MKKKKILFISRSYPPIVGGMEKYSYELFNSLNKSFKVFPIVNKIGKRFMPIFIIISVFKSIYIIKRNNINIIVLTDAVMSPVGYLMKKLFPKIRIISVALGIDITYKRFFYQKIVINCLKKVDLIIAISNSTRNICKERGIKNIKVINCGINTKEFLRKSKEDILLINKFPQFIGKKILLSVGRIVKRKGFVWFAENVMPKLNNNYVYVIIGGGNNIPYNKFERNVVFLGKQSDKVLYSFYKFKGTKALIMPNIKTEGDIEGFGIVAIESALLGLPVIASDMEGMQDSVINNKTGYLVKQSNANSFVNAIYNINKINRNNINKIIENRFDWNIIGKKWLNCIKNF